MTKPITKQGKKIGWCGWHRTRLNPKQSLLVGERQSITGKWSPCCKRCWNKGLRLQDNSWSGLFNCGMKLYD